MHAHWIDLKCHKVYRKIKEKLPLLVKCKGQVKERHMDGSELMCMHGKDGSNFQELDKNHDGKLVLFHACTQRYAIEA